MQNYENDLVGIIIALLDKFGLDDATFTDKEMDVIADKYSDHSLQVAIDYGHIHISIVPDEKKEKAATSEKVVNIH